MDKLSVSYYLSETLVSKIDERGRMISNRSAQLAEDLTQYYDMLDFGLKTCVRIFTSDELRIIISVIKARTHKTWPSWLTAKSSLLDCFFRFDGDADAIKTKIEHLDNLTCFALYDWAKSNS